MSSAIAIERGLKSGDSGQLAVEAGVPPVLPFRIGDDRNPAELEFWHIQETLAKQDSLEMIAKRAWSQEGNLSDLLQTGIIGAFAWEHSPLVLAGEALHLGLAKLKTLERGISLDEALETPISDTSPDLFKGLSWLLTAATVASVLPVPANLMAKTSVAGSQKAVEQPENSSAGGQGPEFKIPGWAWTAAGGIGLLGLITACARAFGLPEPAVKVATNTPDVGPSLTPTERPSATHTATLAATPTETPFFGAGGPELPGGAPDQIRSLLETGINLPTTVCVASPETGGNKEVWDDWIKTLVKNRANQTAIDELKATITAKLAAWGINGSTTLELCSGGGGGWSFAVRDKYSKSFWWSYDLKNQRFADRPDQVFKDRDWQFRPMPRKGLKSGLEVEIMMVNGWPLAVAVNPEGRPIQYFDPVLGESINFYPDPPTPTRTASATSTITNTPRPSAIPATEIPATAIPKPSPIPPEPSATALPGPTPWTVNGFKCETNLPFDRPPGYGNTCFVKACFIADDPDTNYNELEVSEKEWGAPTDIQRDIDKGLVVPCPSW